MSSDRHPPAERGRVAAAIIGAVLSLVLLSIALPLYVAFIGLLQSAPFFGEQPSDAQRQQTATSIWIALAVSAVSLAIIIVLAVVSRGRRGSAALIVFSVLAGVLSLAWLLGAGGIQASATQVSSGHPAGGSARPSPAPTELDGRYLPDAQGTLDAEAIVGRLRSISFPADADADQVTALIAPVSGSDPEVEGTAGDVAVGLFVGHRACVVGTVQNGTAAWSVTGLSTDGGCLGPHHA